MTDDAAAFFKPAEAVRLASSSAMTSVLMSVRILRVGQAERSEVLTLVVPAISAGVLATIPESNQSNERNGIEARLVMCAEARVSSRLAGRHLMSGSSSGGLPSVARRWISVGCSVGSSAVELDPYPPVRSALRKPWQRKWQIRCSVDHSPVTQGIASKGRVSDVHESRCSQRLLSDCTSSAPVRWGATRRLLPRLVRPFPDLLRDGCSSADEGGCLIDALAHLPQLTCNFAQLQFFFESMERTAGDAEMRVAGVG